MAKSKDSTKQKLNNVLSLFYAFKALNGLEKVVSTETGNKIVVEPYDFDGKAIWNISRNLGILKQHVDAFETLQKDLLKAAAPDGWDAIEEPLKTEKINALNAKLEAILNEEVDLSGMLKVSFAGLNAGKNKLSPGNLTALGEYLVE